MGIMEKIKDLATVLLVVVLVAAGAAAAIIIPVTNSILTEIRSVNDKLSTEISSDRDSISADIRSIRESVERVSDLVYDNRAQAIVLQYMLDHHDHDPSVAYQGIEEPEDPS